MEWAGWGWGGVTARGEGEVKEQEGFFEERGRGGERAGEGTNCERERARERTEGSGRRRSDK